MVELFPVPAVPANRVEANGEFSTGRLQASSDHGALSYILGIYNDSIKTNRKCLSISV